jgi:hypothetical protein
MLRDRVEKAKVYLEAVAIYEPVDVEAAVGAFLSGSAPGHNPAFAPPAPFVGAETRRQMNLRLDSVNRNRKPALPAPTIEHSPAERARVAAMADDLVKRTAEQLNTPDNATHRKEVWGPVHQRFYPDMSPAATRRRLGFDVGDADEDAA